jgi:hypothetical protein
VGMSVDDLDALMGQTRAAITSAMPPELR